MRIPTPSLPVTLHGLLASLLIVSAGLLGCAEQADGGAPAPEDPSQAEASAPESQEDEPLTGWLAGSSPEGQAQSAPGEAVDEVDEAAPLESPHTASSTAFQQAPTDLAAELLATPLTPTLYVDAPDALVLVEVLSADDAPVVGAAVSATFTLTESTEVVASCETDEDGRCTVAWSAPESEFEDGGAIAVVVTVGPLETNLELTALPTPQPLTISRPGAGLQLPISPRAEGDTFEVPVYVETTGTVPAAYDIALGFDAALLQVVGVSAGGCAAFATPVSNLTLDANATGQLVFNALNTASVSGCVAAERVHVATVQFMVMEGAAGGDTLTAAPVTCTLRDLIDGNLVTLASDKPCDVADAVGVDTAGEVLVKSDPAP